ncbi:MAG TPA: putative aminohydrolase SsnA [Firmicutes bacterium]|jgi:putative selenium metabolism protein SsnA|nr:putative aminohydrolase SsnA [Bacillota bacterium]
MLLVGNGLVITRDDKNTIIQDGCVAIQDNLIVEVGSTAELKGKFHAARFIDAEHKLIMPGLINTHMHFYSTFARGMASKSAPPTNFLEILERLWWKLDKVLTLDDIYYSAMIPIIDCIKTGTTTVFDHHASPNTVHGSLFKIAEATGEAGLRSCLCYEVSERDGGQIADYGIQENIDFINYCNQEKNPLLKGMFGLHASLTLSDRILDKCVNENNATGAGFHIHAAEGIQDLQDAKDKYGMGVVERLDARGILGEKSIAVHCVHISPQEIEILKNSGTNVVHNPESNMGNAVGVSPVLEMFHHGVRMGLGTDGYTSDMFESFKAANCLHKHASQHPSAAWGEIPHMLFENNRKIAAEYFEKPVGRLATGAYADLIVVDYFPPTRLSAENVNSHLLFGVSGRSVETTVINGQVVMENRKLTTLDEEAICTKSRELADKLWERI